MTTTLTPLTPSRLAHMNATANRASGRPKTRLASSTSWDSYTTLDTPSIQTTTLTRAAASSSAWVLK